MVDMEQVNSYTMPLKSEFVRITQYCEYQNYVQLCFCKVFFQWACLVTKEWNIFIILGEKSELHHKLSGF